MRKNKPITQRVVNEPGSELEPIWDKFCKALGLYPLAGVCNKEISPPKIQIRAENV
jgi:hypothetical protein